MTVTVQPQAGIYGRQSQNKAKSIAEQLAAGKAIASESGWALAGTYQDGSSASRYARKQRDDWQRALDDIADGVISVLILWEASRGDRTLTTWSQLLDLCREKGVSIYVIADERLYDPRKARDWKTLATAGVDSAGESDLISMRVIRGQAGAAALGRPAHGRTPYGYRRTYDPATGELTGQEPDLDAAPIVKEIFRRLAKGEPVSIIVKDLNRRAVPPGGGGKQWYRARLRLLANNRAYIGERVHRQAAVPGIWPALVKPAVFYTVQRVLTDPKRRKTKPGRALHLLSYIGTCVPCGGPWSVTRGRYQCVERGCVSVNQAVTDAFVETMMFARLDQPDVYEALRQHGDADDQAVLEADNEVAALQLRLDEWRLSAARGQASPATMAVVEAELVPQIAAAQRRSALASIPPELRALLEPGADVRKRWKDTPMAARRRIVMHLAEVRADRSPKPGSRHFDPARLGKSRWAGDPLTWGEKWTAGEA